MTGPARAGAGRAAGRFFRGARYSMKQRSFRSRRLLWYNKGMKKLLKILFPAIAIVLAAWSFSGCSAKPSGPDAGHQPPSESVRETESVPETAGSPPAGDEDSSAGASGSGDSDFGASNTGGSESGGTTGSGTGGGSDTGGGSESGDVGRNYIGGSFVDPRDYSDFDDFYDDYADDFDSVEEAEEYYYWYGGY